MEADLYYAIEERRDVEVAVLLENPLININWVNPGEGAQRQTFLHVASAKGTVLAVERLLAHPRIKVSEKNCDGETPLVLACRRGDLNIVGLFLEDSRINRPLTEAERKQALLVAAVNELQEVIDAFVISEAVPDLGRGDHDLVQDLRNTFSEKDMREKEKAKAEEQKLQDLREEIRPLHDEERERRIHLPIPALIAVDTLREETSPLRVMEADEAAKTLTAQNNRTQMFQGIERRRWILNLLKQYREVPLVARRTVMAVRGLTGFAIRVQPVLAWEVYVQYLQGAVNKNGV